MEVPTNYLKILSNLNLSEIFICSKVEFKVSNDLENDDIRVNCKKVSGLKCERCWKISDDVKIDSSFLMDSELAKKVNLHVSNKIGQAVEFKTEFFDKVESSLLKIERDAKEKLINDAYAKISKSEVVIAFTRRFDGKVLKESIKH